MRRIMRIASVATMVMINKMKSSLTLKMSILEL